MEKMSLKQFLLQILEINRYFLTCNFMYVLLKVFIVTLTYHVSFFIRESVTCICTCTSQDLDLKIEGFRNFYFLMIYLLFCPMIFNKKSKKSFCVVMRTIIHITLETH